MFHLMFTVGAVSEFIDKSRPNAPPGYDAAGTKVHAPALRFLWVE